MSIKSATASISLRTHRKAEIKIEAGLDASTDQLVSLIDSIRALLTEAGFDGIAVYLVDTGKTAHMINVDYLSLVSQPMEQFLQQRQDILLKIIGLMEQNQIQMAGASTDIVVTNKSV